MWKFCVKAQFQYSFWRWKLCLYTIFPRQEIRWNYGILRSENEGSVHVIRGEHHISSLRPYFDLIFDYNYTLIDYFQISLHLSDRTDISSCFSYKNASENYVSIRPLTIAILIRLGYLKVVLAGFSLNLPSYFKKN